MSTFIQLHMLTPYAPSNLNRDDLGRPKTAIVGGTQRLRISSQSLKRAWRTSEFFMNCPKGLAEHTGTRTKEMGRLVYEVLTGKGIDEKDAEEWSRKVAGVFGKVKKTGVEIEQLAHFSPKEKEAVLALADRLADEKREPANDELKLLQKKHTAVDIAMYGRMLADDPGFNTEAAVQVAHAFTVDKCVVEDDFFTAVDDLNEGIEDVGAGHMGETQFGAGLFYLYICINTDLLKENLSNQTALANSALKALTEAAATVAPTGKQNSFASRAYAQYILAEKGTRQPRSLATAFLKPVSSQDYLAEAINNLEETRDKMDRAYGSCASATACLNVPACQGTLADVLEFVGGQA